jgi:hypothetical protein
MATFHPFPRLPLELRMQVWVSAFVEDRILEVRRVSLRRDHWSPSPVPAVTRVCQESRQHCSYQKAFIVDGSSRYIWTKFDSDIIQMLGSVMHDLMDYNCVGMNEIRRLRIKLGVERDSYESEFFCHIYNYRIRELPKLEGCDVLVYDGLYRWGDLIEDTYWGVCPECNVRIIDAKTGEWIGADTAGPYMDWIDTSRGETTSYVRLDRNWDEENEEDVEARYNTMMKMKDPLPRIDLNH